MYNMVSRVFAGLHDTYAIMEQVRHAPCEEMLISPQPDQERNKLQRPNSGFLQHTTHEAQYTSQPVDLTFASHSKKIRILSVQPGLRGSSYLCVGRKIAIIQLFFQSREQVVVRRGHIQRIGWVIKTLQAVVGQFLPGCKYPVSRGIVVQDYLGDLSTAFLLQNVLQLHQQRQ